MLDVSTELKATLSDRGALVNMAKLTCTFAEVPLKLNIDTVFAAIFTANKQLARFTNISNPGLDTFTKNTGKKVQTFHELNQSEDYRLVIF